MTTATLPAPRWHQDATPHTPLGRWRLRRAGIVNVWHYLDQEFDIQGGRLVLRGTNGSGKSRALEMLLPFLLDADRRRMDATGSGKVRLEELMRVGGGEQGNRLGYLWLEVVRFPQGAQDDRSSARHEKAQYLTIGALVRFARSTAEAKVWYFTTPQRVGHELMLMDETRTPLSRDQLVTTIGADRITDRAEVHREKVRTQVFGLTGEAGRQRYAGLLQLLHTLRSPDVGNRIDEGRLPQILSAALPPLSDQALAAAGEELDGLEETRAALARLEDAWQRVTDFHKVYSRYATGVLVDSVSEAREAARQALAMEQQESEQARAYEQLVQEHAQALAAQEEAESYVRELAATAAGLKDSRAYREARELSERLGRLEALASATDHALQAAAATRREETTVASASAHAGAETQTAVRAGADLLTQLHSAVSQARFTTRVPSDYAAELRQPTAASEPVRIRRDADPVAVTRPDPTLLAPAPDTLREQLAALLQASAETGEAAHLRRDQAMARARDAVELDAGLRGVQRAEERAEESTQEARLLEESATEAFQRRDDCAVLLAEAWRSWITVPDGRTLLPGVDWADSAAAALLLDVHALAGEDEEGREQGTDLKALDVLPNQAAGPARAAHARELAALDAAEQQAASRRAELEAEAAALRQARDVPPPAPVWADNPPANGIALWRLLDFKDGLSAREQAGLEAALLASGLLTAHVTADGVVTESGQLLVSSDASVVVPSLRSVLTASSGHQPVRDTQVLAVLDRIALDVSGHATWISRDGSFGIGALRGRHALPAARYIGATARAAARAERLRQITQELSTLHSATEVRERERSDVLARQEALEAHLAAAPRSHELAALRLQAVSARRSAVAKQRQAAELTRTAERERRQWAAAERAHRERCAAFNLPVAEGELNTVAEAAGHAASLCRNLTAAGASVTSRLSEMEKAQQTLAETADRRRQAEATAGMQWALWAAQAAELAALQDSIGASAEQVHAQLAEVEAATVQAEEERSRHSRTVTDLVGRLGTAEATLAASRQSVQEAHVHLHRAAAVLATRASHPALAPAATGRPAAPLLPGSSPADIAQAAQKVQDMLARPSARADVTALLRALSALEREVTGTFDVLITVEDELHVVELADADGRRHVHEAVHDLKEQRDRGREALTSRERAAFEHFVLGGMAEELRLRISQASKLVKDMNTSLRSIATSHGIGVRLRWQLAEDTEHPLARINDLVSHDTRVLRADQQEELIELLKARVEERFRADPQAGYTVHLRDTMDYRSWYTLEAIITGPEPGRERRLSRRAKLSQGETRFVSYVTLFAAADAYLSGLPDADSALRLILLDDAFAKVDNRTIADLMRLLVRLDLDFVMTGHALWGFFPEVPFVDAYEVRRAEGTSAITTHVHWDGRTRHLHLAGQR
ncbi:TIGR02680 family protein [Streptomyces sp. NPDC021212]|uniref:TIGR02680 family protein n=1 Tax=Streptomyces sp. NPDC021212 TaxID=3365118 RepID=UPI0037A2104A